MISNAVKLDFKLDRPPPSGNGLKTVIILENLYGLILNIGTCIITIDTILQIFAYPCATRYADFIGFSGEPHLKKHSILRYFAHLTTHNVPVKFCTNRPFSFGVTLELFLIKNT